MLRLALIFLLCGVPAMAKEDVRRHDPKEHVSEQDQAAVQEVLRDIQAMHDGKMTFREFATKPRPNRMTGKRSGIHDSPEFPERIEKIPR